MENTGARTMEYPLHLGFIFMIDSPFFKASVTIITG